MANYEIHVQVDLTDFPSFEKDFLFYADDADVCELVAHNEHEAYEIQERLEAEGHRVDWRA